MTPSQSSVARTLAVGYDSPISAASLSAQLPTGLGAGNAVAGRSADATKKALLRARTLERSVGHCGAARSPAAIRCCRRSLCRSMHVARQRGSTIADHS